MAQRMGKVGTPVTRYFNDWEVEDVERLLVQLGKVTLVDMEDTMRWTVTKWRCFLS